MASEGSTILNDAITFPQPPLHERDVLTMEVYPSESMEADLTSLEANIRAIRLPGLAWGSIARESVAFGIDKLVANAMLTPSKTGGVVDTERVLDAIKCLQWGNHAAVKSVAFAQLTK